MMTMSLNWPEAMAEHACKCKKTTELCTSKVKICGFSAIEIQQKEGD